MARLRGISGLMELVKSPFMLKMVLDTLPGIAIARTQMTRAELYDEFVEFHFENEQERLIRGRMEANCLAAFNEVEGEGFIVLSIDFSKRLSGSIFKEQEGVNSVEFLAATDIGSWKTEFFGPGAMTKLMRESSQLVCRANVQQSQRVVHNGNRQASKRNLYEFSHRSILEYFYSRLIYDPCGNPPHLDLSACIASPSIPSTIAEHPLGQRNLVSEPSIIHFLVDRVQQSDEFKHQLNDIIHFSKTDYQVSQAAANAITILVRAGEIFNGKDLQGIKIPGADLTGGQFDSSNLQGADLEKVNLTGTWLRQADLSGAQLKDVCFGEKPFLEQQGFEWGASSADYKTFVLSQGSDIHVYDSADKKPVKTLRGHESLITCLDISNDGLHIASGSMDKTVRVWDLKGTCRVLKVHSRSINAVSFSPDGTRIAIARGKRVRVWDVRSEKEICAFEGHTSKVNSLAWSPDGRLVASVGYGHSFALLWEAETGVSKDVACTSGKRYYYQSYKGVAVSQDGWLATCVGNEVHLRDLSNKNDYKCAVLKGHTDTVICVNFSPNGLWIVTTSHDRTVRVWETLTASLACRLDGYTGVAKHAFFLNNREVVSIEYGGIVMLWDLGIYTSRKGIIGNGTNSWLQGHTSPVTSVVYSPYKGKSILSCSLDGNVNKWSARMGTHVNVASIQHGCRRPPSALFLSGGQRIAIADGDLKVYCRQEGVYVPEHAECRKAANVIACTPRGSRIAYAVQGGDLNMWDLNSNKKHIVDPKEDHYVEHLVLSFNDKFAFISHGEVFVGYIDDEDHPRMSAWNTDPYSVRCDPVCLAYSPHGDMIVIGFEDGPVAIESRTKTLHVFDVLKDVSLKCCVWSTDGNWIAFGCWDGTVQLLRVGWSPDKKFPQRLSWECAVRGFGGPVNSLAWHPVAGEAQFVTGSSDCSVCVWKLTKVNGTDNFQVQLVWGSFSSRFVAAEARIMNTKGLDKMQSKFLQERGANNGSPPLLAEETEKDEGIADDISTTTDDDDDEDKDDDEDEETDSDFDSENDDSEEEEDEDEEDKEERDQEDGEEDDKEDNE